MAENFNRRQVIVFENTKFIFVTNFSGDPSRDNYGSSERKANIIIPSKEMADRLSEDGFNVRVTKPREGYEDEYEPQYYINIKLNYNFPTPPVVYMVKDGRRTMLQEAQLVDIDHARITNVNAVCNPYFNQKRGTKSLYVQTMYVEVDSNYDPFAERYMPDDDEIPFA